MGSFRAFSYYCEQFVDIVNCLQVHTGHLHPGAGEDARDLAGAGPGPRPLSLPAGHGDGHHPRPAPAPPRPQGPRPRPRPPRAQPRQPRRDRARGRGSAQDLGRGLQPLLRPGAGQQPAGDPGGAPGRQPHLEQDDQLRDKGKMVKGIFIVGPWSLIHFTGRIFVSPCDHH